MVKKWEKLPEEMRTDAVRPYYDILVKKNGSLLLKRVFDVIVSAIMLVLLSPVFFRLVRSYRSNLSLENSDCVCYNRKKSIETYESVR